MRLVALYAVAAVLALALQTALPTLVSPRFLVPNLIVILAVDLGLRHHGALAALMAFAMGYATDSTSGTRLGANALLVTMVFLLTYEVSRRLLVTTSLFGAVAVFAGAILTGVGALAITTEGAALARAGTFFPDIAAQAAISALIAPPVFGLLGRLKRTIGLPAGPQRE